MRIATYACRSCGGQNLHTVLSLGRTPLANRLLRPEQLEQPEPKHPLDLAFCPDCTLLQLLESVSPELLYNDYIYQSSYSDTMVRHAADLAGRLTNERGLGAASLVVEAASNDGYLLQHYRRAGVGVLGIEPAEYLVALARQRHGIPSRQEFFTESLATQLVSEGLRADVFHAHNVLAHVPDLNGFVRGIAALLRPDGVALIEVPYARCLLEHCEFDTIYHEHLCYFSLTAVVACFARNGLTVVDVEVLPIHGGSLRIFASPTHASVMPGPRVAELLDQEKADGMTEVAYYEGFASRVRNLARELRLHLANLKQAGRKIAAYGASAKGSTLLNYCGIDGNLLEFVVDRNQDKQGLYTPGTHLRIVPPEDLLRERPDYVLLLTWNFADEILAQQAEYRRRGGRFILPVPEVRVA
jgi:SAM-dependent methyltransferase